MVSPQSKTAGVKQSNADAKCGQPKFVVLAVAGWQPFNATLSANPLAPSL
jgi:hypothetical protein